MYISQTAYSNCHITSYRCNQYIIFDYKSVMKYSYELNDQQKKKREECAIKVHRSRLTH